MTYTTSTLSTGQTIELGETTYEVIGKTENRLGMGYVYFKSLSEDASRKHVFVAMTGNGKMQPRIVMLWVEQRPVDLSQFEKYLDTQERYGYFRIEDKPQKETPEVTYQIFDEYSDDEGWLMEDHCGDFNSIEAVTNYLNHDSAIGEFIIKSVQVDGDALYWKEDEWYADYGKPTVKLDMNNILDLFVCFGRDFKPTAELPPFFKRSPRYQDLGDEWVEKQVDWQIGIYQKRLQASRDLRPQKPLNLDMNNILDVLAIYTATAKLGRMEWNRYVEMIHNEVATPEGWRVYWKYRLGGRPTNDVRPNLDMNNISNVFFAYVLGCTVFKPLQVGDLVHYNPDDPYRNDLEIVIGGLHSGYRVVRNAGEDAKIETELMAIGTFPTTHIRDIRNKLGRAIVIADTLNAYGDFSMGSQCFYISWAQINCPF